MPGVWEGGDERRESRRNQRLYMLNRFIPERQFKVDGIAGTITFSAGAIILAIPGTITLSPSLSLSVSLSLSLSLTLSLSFSLSLSLSQLIKYFYNYDGRRSSNTRHSWLSKMNGGCSDFRNAPQNTVIVALIVSARPPVRPPVRPSGLFSRSRLFAHPFRRSFEHHATLRPANNLRPRRRRRLRAESLDLKTATVLSEKNHSLLAARPTGRPVCRRQSVGCGYQKAIGWGPPRCRPFKGDPCRCSRSCGAIAARNVCPGGRLHSAAALRS